MSRLPTLFAIAAMSLLGVGLLVPRLDLRSGMTLSLPRATYMIPNRMLCYGAALCFCLFAFLYSLRMVPWSAPAQRWHLGLSVFCLAMFFAALASFERSAAAGRETNLTLSLVIVASAAPVLFVLIQALYLLDGLRRCWWLFIRS